MKLFDTHAHLLDAQFDHDRNEVIAALPGADVCGFVEACCESADIPRIAALVLLYDYVYGSAGVHPHSADTADAASLSRVERALADPKIVAVGEIGLDYHYDFSPREVQRAAFAEQLDIAAAAKKPVIIHDREAHGDTMALLSARRGRLAGVLHCYSGSFEDAARYVDMGFYIAFGGALTFKNAVRQRDIAARLPLEHIVVETDCPYLAPEPRRGARNDPRLLRFTLEALARARGIPREEAARATTDNALRLFNLAQAAR